MPRNVPTPRVVIPTKTSEIKDLSMSVSGLMEEEVAFNGADAASLAWIAIWTPMQNDANAAHAKLNEVIAKENEVALLRAELAILNTAQTTELRNARDLIFGLFPENPMEVAAYGFTAFVSGSSGTSGDGDPPVDPDGDDDPITPV